MLTMYDENRVDLLSTGHRNFASSKFTQLRNHDLEKTICFAGYQRKLPKKPKKLVGSNHLIKKGKLRHIIPEKYNRLYKSFFKSDMKWYGIEWNLLYRL